MDAQNATTPPCRTVVNADELHGERYYSSLSLTELSLFIKACEVARRSGNRHGSHGLIRLVANPGLRGLTDDAGSGGLSLVSLNRSPFAATRAGRRSGSRIQSRQTSSCV